MFTFETPTCSHALLSRFERWFAAEIGTEIETDEVELGQWSATCFELERSEVGRCREWFDNNR